MIWTKERSNPGIQQVRRDSIGEQMVVDLLYSELIGPPPEEAMGSETTSEDLLVPMLRGGRVGSGLGALGSSIRRLDNAARYSVKLEQRLMMEKQSLIAVVDKRD